MKRALALLLASAAVACAPPPGDDNEAARAGDVTAPAAPAAEPEPDRAEAPAPEPPKPPPPPPPAESYMARGQEPGWILKIEGDKLDYTGNYGETRIVVPRPDPRPSFNGRRYETPRLTVDISYTRCNDGMSGHGYEHEVLVIADGESYRGCGGARRPEWDA